MSTSFRISMDGAQQVGPVVTSASGLGTAVYDSVAHTLEYTIYVSGLDFGNFVGVSPQTVAITDDVIDAHFHAGARDANGGVVLAWKPQDADDFSAILQMDGSWRVHGIWELTDASSTSLSTFEAALASTATGVDMGLYANIHTNAFGGGEIRGQLVGLSTDGADTVNGTSGNDLLYGLGGDDIINGSGGNDWIQGGAGHATIDGGEGVDTLDYSDGWLDAQSHVIYIYLHVGATYAHLPGSGVVQFDTVANVENVVGAHGADVIYGTGVGNVLIGGGSADSLFGGAGNDTIYGDQAPGSSGPRDSFDYLYGEEGDDILVGSDIASPSSIVYSRYYGGAGNDTIAAGNTGDLLQGDQGVDIMHGGGGADLLYVDHEDVIVTGDEGADFLAVADLIGANISASDIENWFGYSGNDTFNATGASTLIYMRGAGGTDTLTGGSVGDWLYGDDGDDVVNGGDGNDTLIGGNGADQLFGGDGVDLLYVDNSDTGVSGGTGTDYLVVQDTAGVTVNLAASSIEWAQGFSGDDVLFATGATVLTEIHGGDGADVLVGGSTVSILLGENGADRLVSEAGTDHFVGGAGADTVVLSSNGGTDYLYDYQDGSDKIDLEATGLTDFSQLTIDNTYAADNWYGVGYGTGTLWVNTGGTGTLEATDFVF